MHCLSAGERNMVKDHFIASCSPRKLFNFINTQNAADMSMETLVPTLLCV
jgi:hypothetical protein